MIRGKKKLEYLSAFLRNLGDIPAEFWASVRLCSQLSWLALEHLCLPGGQKKSVSEHLALSFWGWAGFWGVAGWISLGFLLTLVYHSLFPVRNIWRSSSAELSQTSNYSSLWVSIGYSWAQGKNKIIKKKPVQACFPGLSSVRWDLFQDGWTGSSVWSLNCLSIFFFFLLQEKGVKALWKIRIVLMFQQLL